jgi:hypothetical protein
MAYSLIGRTHLTNQQDPSKVKPAETLNNHAEA